MKVMTKINSCIAKIAMSAIIRVSRHIERKKALREREAEIFKNDEFLLERAKEEFDKNKNKRNEIRLLTVKMIF